MKTWDITTDKMAYLKKEKLNMSYIQYDLFSPENPDFLTMTVCKTTFFLFWEMKPVIPIVHSCLG